MEKLAGRTVARDNRPRTFPSGNRVFKLIESQVGFAMSRIRPMTAKAFVGKQRADVAVVFDLRSRFLPARGCEHRHMSDKDRHHARRRWAESGHRCNPAAKTASRQEKSR